MDRERLLLQQKQAALQKLAEEPLEQQQAQPIENQPSQEHRLETAQVLEEPQEYLTYYPPVFV